MFTQCFVAALIIQMTLANNSGSSRPEDVVMNLKLVSDQDTIHASWDFTNPSGHVNRFRVTYSIDDEARQGLSRFIGTCVVLFPGTSTRGSPECTSLIPKLFSCVRYKIRVDPAQDGFTTGVRAEAHAYTLGGPSIESITSVSVTSDFVTVGIVRQYPGCEITHYLISYTGRALDTSGITVSGGQRFQITNPRYSEVTIRSLEPDMNYKICATSFLGEQEGQQKCIDNIITP